mgnify:FL=1
MDYLANHFSNTFWSFGGTSEKNKVIWIALGALFPRACGGDSAVLSREKPSKSFFRTRGIDYVHMLGRAIAFQSDASRSYYSNFR